MLYEQFGRTELHSCLPERHGDQGLTAYARPPQRPSGRRRGSAGRSYPARRRVSGTAPTEGEPVALAFLNAGIQAFVLDYSVLPARWPQQL